MHTVTSICLQLKEHKQRASLSAVAGVLEMSPKLVLSGKPKNHLYSWIVERPDNKPVAFEDPELKNAETPIIFGAKELEEWLENPDNQSHADESFVFLIEKMVN